MAEWFLVWMLTVETYAGEIDTRVLSMQMESRTDCIQEAKAKDEQLRIQVGTDHIVNYNYETPFKIQLGGKLLGVSVGCDLRE
jgi:hypothetical protein